MGDLLERDEELRALRALVDRVAAGGSGAVLLEGVAGIGKSSLLQAAAAVAGTAGLSLRTARAGELEQQLPYGVAVQLLEADAADPALLTGPAALAAGALRLQQGGGVAGEHAAVHGLYWLVAQLAERAPVLLCVDDLHWADEESLRWLSYLVRRYDDLPVGLVLASRPVAGDRARVRDALVAEPGVVVLRPAPLSEAASAAAVARELGADATDVVAALAGDCFAATGGNPLLLRELGRGLRDLAPGGPAPADVARVAPEEVGASVRRRVAALPAGADRLVEAAAVLGRTTLERAARLAGVPHEEAPALAAALVRAGLLRAAEDVELEHPLVRTTVHEGLLPPYRAQLHGRAAEVLLATGADVTEAAVHLVAATPDTRARHLPELLAAATESARRGAPEAAVRLLAAVLPEVQGARRVDVLAALGRLEAALGRYSCVEHLTEVCRLASDPVVRGRCALLLADVLTLSGRSHEVVAVLTDDFVAGVAAADPELGTRVLAAAVPAWFMVDGGILTADMRRRLAALGAPAGRTVAEREALAAVALAAGTAEEVRRFGRTAVGEGRLSASELPGAAPLFLLLLRLTLCEELDLVEAVVDTVLVDARSRAATLDIARFSFLRGVVAARRGDFARSVTECSYALEAMEDQGIAFWPTAKDSTLYRLVASLCCRGELRQAREAVTRWRDSAGGVGIGPLQLAAQLARLDLLEGHVTEGLERLRALLPIALAHPLHDVHFTFVLTTAAPLLRQAGEPVLAQQAADAACAAAEQWGVPRLTGNALVARGLVRGGTAGRRDLEEACALLAGTPAVFEHATALVELGAALRRERRPQDAREPLRLGLELAASCGAELLVERARQELLASGARPRRVRSRGADSLTPSELRVALLACDGLSNAEIAQALFVSRKTVEKHLGNAFGKLEVAGRSGLREALAPPEVPA